MNHNTRNSIQGELIERRAMELIHNLHPTNPAYDPAFKNINRKKVIAILMKEFSCSQNKAKSHLDKLEIVDERMESQNMLESDEGIIDESIDTSSIEDDIKEEEIELDPETHHYDDPDYMTRHKLGRDSNS